MGRKKLYLWAAFFIVLISVEATFVRAQSDGKGNGNNGDGNGSGNNGDGDGSGNSGNNGNGNGSGNNSNGNGSGNNGNGNGNGNNGNGNGSGNNGNGNGNGNSGNDNGNGSGNGNGIGSGSNGNGSGSGNGNGSSSDNGNGNNGNDNGNGNGNNGNGNGNGNNGNGNGNGNNGNGNGNGNNGNGNGNGNNGNGNGNGNNGNGNGNGNNGNGNGNGNNGNGNGNGNNGNGNGNGNNGNGNGNGNNGNGNGNGNNGDGNGNGNGNNNYDATTDYVELTPLGSGQERALCKAEGDCNYKILTCPSQCPQKKPKKNKKNKGCYVDCGSKCEATCKYRKPNCNGYGSLCYDPRFVGGDGVMFYFHGTKGGNFAIVSDHEFQINAHFIGTRPQGRTRDFTWVQALSIMFETHTLVIAAKRVSHWDNNVDALIVMWDGKAVKIPTDGEAEWRTNGEDRQVVVERTDDNNNVRVKVAGLVELYINIRAIGKEENKVHNYRLPDDDAFAHLETQFKFSNLSHLVEGVLGKTYRPDYVTSVKIGVPMPMMGGEDKYQTPSLYSTLCKACRFQRPSGLFANSNGVAQY